MTEWTNDKEPTAIVADIYTRNKKVQSVRE